MVAAHILEAWFDAPVQCQLLGNGFINDTFKVTDNRGVGFVLQRINTVVFTNPAAIMHNYRLVFDYLSSQDFVLQLPALVPTKNGQDYIIDNDGQWWRLTTFIAGTTSLNQPKTADNAWQTAFGFGCFTAALTDFPVEQLQITIPNFHDLPNRFAMFSDAWKSANPTRKKQAGRAMKKTVEYSYLITTTQALWPTLPLRVTHNDTKINNILLDKTTHKPVAVIDWDTIMPGTILSDFGDLVRTAACTADEEETDLAKVDINLEYLEALKAGFLSGCGGSLTDLEQKTLWFGAKNIIFEQALRFLTDFLQDDIYYKTTHSTHNLMRAENQFALLDALCRERKSDGN